MKLPSPAGRDWTYVLELRGERVPSKCVKNGRVIPRGMLGAVWGASREMNDVGCDLTRRVRFLWLVHVAWS